MIGSVISDRFRVEALLGEGGMGVVYSAYELRLKRMVALKLLRREYAENEQMVQRFLAEATAQASIVHPNITTIHDQFTWEGRPIIVMELLDGETFASIIARRGPIPAHVCLPWVIDALAGLAAAHARGIVHRDLKPANLMMTKAEVVKVMDFGIARMEQTPGLTRTAAAIGTPYYMSPEQIDRTRFGLKKIDFRADIYAMGVTLYELLAGAVPFHGDSEYAIQRAHLEERPEPPTTFYPYIPDSVVAAVSKAMSKNPADRFANAAAFSAQLKRCLPDAYKVGGVATNDLPQIFDSASDTAGSLSPAILPDTESLSAGRQGTSDANGQSLFSGTDGGTVHPDRQASAYRDFATHPDSSATSGAGFAPDLRRIEDSTKTNPPDSLLVRWFGQTGHPRLVGAIAGLLVVAIAGIVGFGFSNWYEARAHTSAPMAGEGIRSLAGGSGSISEASIPSQKQQEEPIGGTGKNTVPTDTKKPQAGKDLPQEASITNVPSRIPRAPIQQLPAAPVAIVAGSWAGSIQPCNERASTPASLRISESSSTDADRLIITGQLRLGSANCRMAGSYDRKRNRLVLQAQSCSPGAPDFLSRVNSSILSLQNSELSGAVSPSCAVVKLSRTAR